MASPRTILAVAVALFLSFLADAGAQDVNGAFAQLQKAVERLSDMTRTQPSTFEPQKIVDLKQKIETLRDAVAKNPPSSAAYVRVLWHQADLLALAAATSNATEARNILDDVSADLNAKLTSSSAAALHARRGLISVTVQTKRDNVEVMGFLINCNPLRFTDAQPMFSFPNLSSPTTYELPPGKYEFMAVKNDLVVARRIADIFVVGQDRLVIDLPVP